MHQDAMWPCFRHDGRNTGRSPIKSIYLNDHPWKYQTGKGIFSTPVIDNEGIVYVGSADHTFYALYPDGSRKWSFTTGEVIDSAAILPAIRERDEPQIIVPSGDGYLYCLHRNNGQIIWKFDARTAPRSSFNNWWEANVAIGSDGTLYAGNTNFNYYAINPDGTLKWTYETGANAWSAGAFAQDGTIYWGSNDTFIHAVTTHGQRKWRRRTLGFISASPAIGTDGTIYIGSFDSFLYALDPNTGHSRWKFKTQDHIYSSAALSVDPQGHTNAIYVGSTDGNLYAVSLDGQCLWRYDTGSPIRSSPVLGQKPEGEQGWIVYFGSSKGVLYALDATSGTRRWSYDTTPNQVILRDRNDLNGSPALGNTGIYIGGEHGQLWYIPYDYPLHHEDPRGCVEPGEDFPRDLTGLYYVTPGGNIKTPPPDTLPISTIITFRLIDRFAGTSREARFFTSPFFKPRRSLRITTNPPIAFTTEVSADGLHLHIIPLKFLEPDTTYTVNITGKTFSGGWHIGNLTIGGRSLGPFSHYFQFRTDTITEEYMPFSTGEDKVSAFELTRMAVPIPTMMPSLNQIGFDYMDWIVGLVDIDEPCEDGTGTLMMWAVGGRRNEKGMLVVDPDTDFMLPLCGHYKNNAFILSNKHFKMRITGIPIPFNQFQIRGQMGRDMVVGESATAYANTKVLSIPTFGPLLVLAGLASNWWQKLLAMATYITLPYEHGPANQRPRNISVSSLDYSHPTRFRDGQVIVHLQCKSGITYPLHLHLPAILLVDDTLHEVVPLDYLENLDTTEDNEGNISTIKLTIPSGTRLPENITAIVMLDVFPFHREKLS